MEEAFDMVLESLRSRFTEIGMQQMCWAILRSYTYKGVNETGLGRSWSVIQ